MITNTHDPGNPEMTSIDKFIGIEFRSHYADAATQKTLLEEYVASVIDPAAESMQSFAQKNDAQMADNLATVPAPNRMARQLEGYLMDARTETERNQARRNTTANEYAALWASTPVLAVLVVWRWKRRHVR